MTEILTPQAIERGFLRRNAGAFLLAWLCIVVVHAFVLRGMLFAIPDILRGTSVISGDELVPFFNADSQFWSQIAGQFSELTNSYEFRVRYALLTTWMRYAPILPLALFGVAVSCACATMTAIALFCRKCCDRALSDGALIRGAMAASLLFHLILLYAKATHFYTLILGWSFFTISLLLLIDALFLQQTPSWKRMLCAVLLTLVNPAVHYVVLFSGLSLVLACVYVTCNRGEPLRGRIMTAAMPIVLLIFGTLIPYAAFIELYVLADIPQIDDLVPVHYYLIRNSSVPILHQLSLDISGISDQLLVGDYLVRNARITNIAYFLVAFVPLLPSVRRRVFSNRYATAASGALFFTLLFTIWCTLGYSLPPWVPTFHRVVAGIASVTYDMDNVIADLITKLLHAVIHVLRFPHRFQLATFSVLATLLCIGLAWIETRLRQIAPRRTPLALLLLLVFPLPLLGNWEYRAGLGSGTLAGLLAPYPTAQLAEVRAALHALPEGKTIVIPSAEARMRISDQNGVQHKFIDKFYIYFLDTPSYNYGLGGSLENREPFFFFYYSLLEGEYGWLNTLQAADVRYLIINRELERTSAGHFSLQQLNQSLQDRVTGAGHWLEKRFENDAFILYEVKDAGPDRPTSVLLSLPWEELLCSREQLSDTGTQYETVYDLHNAVSRDPSVIVTRDGDKAITDLYLSKHPEAFARPNERIFPFDPHVIPSGLYFDTIFSMFNLFGDGKYNYTDMIFPGTYDTLTSSFVALIDDATLTFEVPIAEDGTYTLLLRAIATKNTLRIRAGSFDETRSISGSPEVVTYRDRRALLQGSGGTIDVSAMDAEALEQVVPETIMPVGRAFEYLDLGTIDATKGTLRITLHKTDGNPLVLEGITAVSPDTIANMGELRRSVMIRNPDTFFTPAVR